MNFLRTDSENPDFLKLVALLDKDLAIRDGEDAPFYAQYNKVDRIKYVLLALEGSNAVACGAIKQFEEDEIVEVKRMYTLPAFRGRGIAKQILHELEAWAMELKMKACVLETGKKQPEAIALYKSAGYELISNYGPYTEVENSLCFKKKLV